MPEYDQQEQREQRGGLISDDDSRRDPKDAENKESNESCYANVRSWQDKIKKAKSKWKADFERMRDNMDFVAGIQWKGQKDLCEDRYIVNLTLRAVNQGVAAVYARDPKIEARRRPRMDFKVWDGHMETIIQAAMFAQQVQMAGFPPPPEIIALINDFQQGRLHQELVERVGKTLETVFQYQLDCQQPSFKLQMKQLVRRVRVSGVGYIKVDFCRYFESDLTQSQTRMSPTDRMKIAKSIMKRISDGDLQESSPEFDQLRSLLQSFQTAPLDYETVRVQEHLTFDFPRSTSIIPDTATRALKGWVGARWIAEEMYYPLDFVNAYFEKNIKAGGDVKIYGRDNKPDEGGYVSGEPQENRKNKVCLWTVWDLNTKSTFILCEGYKDYVLEPEPVTPVTKGFWTIVPVTFNDIEVEEGCKATIFPPSDVDLIKSAQREWNRTREGLRKHRKANEPRYLYPNGAISEQDLDRIESAEGQQFVKITGLLPNQSPKDVIQALETSPIRKELYDSEPLREDTLLATGQQEANIGPAQPNVTATVGTIAEQSRMSVSMSDIDGLDDSLTEVAQIGGEMCLKEMSPQTVQHIAGNGAIWPQQDRESFVNEIDLQVVAASSGRPNKAVDIANWDKIAPILMNVGANPQAIIRETIRRADERIDPADFFPVQLPAMPQPTPAQQPAKPRAQAEGGEQANPAQQPY